MINKDRIVPVQATDLISLYGLILNQTEEGGVTALKADDVEGNFTISDGSAALLADEPVATVDAAAGVSAYTLFFVPAYDYAGFTQNGAAATIADNDVEVEPDGRTLYKAVLASGTVTITKLGF